VAPLLGALYLVAVEALFEWHHHRRPCLLAADLYEPTGGSAPVA
jgi:hypothetical protein